MHWSSAAATATKFEEAVAATAAQVRGDLPDETADLAIVFASRHFASRYQELPALLQAELPYQHLLGCSAGGVIGGGREIEERPGLSLTAARLPEVTLTPFSLEGSLLPDDDASPQAWTQVMGVPATPDPCFLLLADPFSFPVPHLLAGLDYAYPQSVKLGGLASGARQPGQNVLYLDDARQDTGAVGVALTGNLTVSTIVAQGCRPVGEPLRITSCRDNILLELENQPALNAIKRLMPRLSSRDRQLASQALFVGVVMDELSGEAQTGDFLIRNIVGLDAKSGALAVGELLRDGQVIQFHVRDAETAAEDLNLLLGRFAQGPQAQTAHGALLFSCLGRGVHLYGRADHDTRAFQERVGDVPLGGFFCNGEIGPVAGATHLHGFTSAFGIFGPVS